jgi:hypothetical protein
MSSTSGTPRTKSVGRAVDLLKAIASRPAGSSASELARVSGLPRSTVARTLRTLGLGARGDRVRRGGWVLGHELVRLLGPATRIDASSTLPVPRSPACALAASRPPRRSGERAWARDPASGRRRPTRRRRELGRRRRAVARVLRREAVLAGFLRARAWLGDGAGRSPSARSSTRNRCAPSSARQATGWQRWSTSSSRARVVSVPVRGRGRRRIVGISGPTFRLGRARRRELLEIQCRRGDQRVCTTRRQRRRRRHEPAGVLVLGSSVSDDAADRTDAQRAAALRRRERRAQRTSAPPKMPAEPTRSQRRPPPFEQAPARDADGDASRPDSDVMVLLPSSGSDRKPVSVVCARARHGNTSGASVRIAVRSPRGIAPARRRARVSGGPDRVARRPTRLL